MWNALTLVCVPSLTYQSLARFNDCVINNNNNNINLQLKTTPEIKSLFIGKNNLHLFDIVYIIKYCNWGLLCPFMGYFAPLMNKDIIGPSLIFACKISPDGIPRWKSTFHL